MKNIYYLTEIDFTNQNASTLRITNVCKALKRTNNIRILGVGNSNVDIDNLINYSYIKKIKTRNLLYRIYFQLIYPFLQIKKIKSLGLPDIIICYGMYGYPLYIHQRFCKRNNIKFIYDAVEWYDYDKYKLKYINPLLLNVHWTMKFLLFKCDGIIAISTYLNDYYAKKGIKTIIVPPLFDMSKEKHNQKCLFEEEYLNLIYAGIPGKKDQLWIAINGVSQLYKQGYKIRLNIFGCTLNYLTQTYNIPIDSECIKLYPRMTQDELKDYLISADFTIIIRDASKRYAKAGFSTKFVESLAYGLPVIANLSGDMNKYLIDGYNGYILEDNSINSFINTMKRIYGNRYIRKNELRENALKTCKENFNLENYTDLLNEFLNNC